MSVNFQIDAELRSAKGSISSRRYRSAGKVPAVLYGAGKDPVDLTVDHIQMMKSLENEAFYSHVLNMQVNGSQERVVLKDIQRHPNKPRILHMDFQRVSETVKMRMHVPLHFIGEDVAPGVKTAGGIVTHMMNNVEVMCLAKNLPEYLEVDLSALEAGQSVHLSDIKCPPGVEIAALLQTGDHDSSVAQITVPRGAKEDDEETTAAVEPAAGEGGA